MGSPARYNAAELGRRSDQLDKDIDMQAIFSSMTFWIATTALGFAIYNFVNLPSPPSAATEDEK